MRTQPSHLLVALAFAGCGASTPLRLPRGSDASVDVSVDVPPLDVAPLEDLPPPPDTPAAEDVPAPIDVSKCMENSRCDTGNPCEIGRINCSTGVPVCRPAGNELPGTVCSGGSCDGRGNCQMSLQRSCPNPSETGCGVVFLTGGSFALGHGSAYRAMPVQQRITVGGFTLDAYEVTVARFQRFWDAGHPAPAGAVVYPSGTVPWTGAVRAPRATTGEAACNFAGTGREYHPVNCVDHATAQAFCTWDGGRLPTEAEWEFAARQQLAAGVDAGRIYPWGPQPPGAACDRAHWNRCPGDDGGVTRRVGRFANTAGFFDLAGNVWEWTADLFAPYADTRCWANVARTDPRCDANASGYPTIRGGSWFSADAVLLMGASRDDAYTPATQSPLVGFRCARTRTR